MKDFTPYLNYVRVETTTNWDHRPIASFLACTGVVHCYQLHNGAGLAFADTFDDFDTTNPTDYLSFLIDPDTSNNNNNNASAAKAVEFSLYINGRITTTGARRGNPAYDPPWFDWN